MYFEAKNNYSEYYANPMLLMYAEIEEDYIRLRLIHGSGSCLIKVAKTGNNLQQLKLSFTPRLIVEHKGIE